jgi:hypothetical protein
MKRCGNPRGTVPETRNAAVLLVVVCCYFVAHNSQFYACQLEHLYCVLVGVVVFFADHPFDARVDYHHGAGSAWRHFAVKRGTIQWDTEFCGLNNRVLFRVKGSYTVL